MTTVLSLFNSLFPGHEFSPDDPSYEGMRDMPLESTCGDDCKSAVLSGAMLVSHIRKAHGDFPEGDRLAKEIAEAVTNVCGVYIHG